MAKCAIARDPSRSSDGPTNVKGGTGWLGVVANWTEPTAAAAASPNNRDAMTMKTDATPGSNHFSPIRLCISHYRRSTRAKSPASTPRYLRGITLSLQ
ncbi:hypothetical protein BN1708_001788 [Verticillium longisporum]|uniref:Uncharacterized protein n=1 Tax=Verticillium longisporum TaxID=100787 RepID=A0A0G4N516_VERLO|nr:hypothetical protein BN1708_001788 [Verticillium longisporum]